ncbi:MAG: Nucleotidyl transferase [Parcubacteria group bacterium Gr01-1014_31]|nr:MAG: Nucleotidyl transferase [Parcubacteria group bacterium Gr01-1014_31]
MSRLRLTITMKNELVKQLDKFIDGSRIRNRSHAIEYLLTKSLGPGISRALILAGGRGQALRPFTYELPKGLLPVAGKPLLEHSVALLRQYGIRDLVISIGSLGAKIKEHFGDGSKFGVAIRYLDQGDAESGTAQPVRQARKFFGNEPFLCYYGDVLAEIDLGDLAEFHLSHKGIATVALTSVAKSSDWGVVALHGSKILRFQEKPAMGQTLSHVINAGVCVFDPAIFEVITPKDKSLESDVFPKLAATGRFFGFPFEGKWFDVGTPEIYEQAVKEWGKGSPSV